MASTSANVEGHGRISPFKLAPFLAVHLIALFGVIASGWSWAGFGLAMALYYVRMFGVTGGYHRYFAHKTFKTSRWFQFVLAWIAMSSSQKGVMWWAAHHRTHHLKSDKPGDVHSVKLDGFWWSHIGWIVSDKWERTEEKNVRDLSKFPEIVWLDKYWFLPPTVLGVGLFVAGGWWALLWGFFVSTTLLWHGTFTINSLSHVFGSRRYKTTDESRNNALLAILTMGEGWHNNHHHYWRSANQGFFWWELDPTFYILKGLETVGLIWDVHVAPDRVRFPERRPVGVQVDEDAALPVAAASSLEG